MARKDISIKTINDDILFGYAWECENPKACLFVMTGMEEHALRYDDFANFLVENNINVYCIDQYGQGSNVADTKNLGIVPSSFFSKSVRILDDLVKKFTIKGIPNIVFGHSMGSFMIQDYIQRYSRRPNKVIICGSNGKNGNLAYQFGYPLARMITAFTGDEHKGKFLKSLAVGAFARSVKNRKTDLDWLSYNEANIEAYSKDPKCGYGSSNGFYRELLKGNHRLYKDKFLKKINPDLKLLIVSGEDDPVGACGKGPRNLEKMYKEYGVKDVNLIMYPHMRHEILNEKDNQKVFNDIINFIKK